MSTAQDVFNRDVLELPPGERLRLAAMILNQLARNPSVLDEGDAWSQEDMRDLAAFSVQVSEERYPDEDDLV